jgi:predicted nucleic acid-binding protein
MKIFFDTSVLVAALVTSHPHHSRAFPWLRKAKEEEIELLISSHTIAELYAVLTTLPVSPRITPGLAWRLMSESVLSCATVAALSSSDYQSTIKGMSELGISGGAVYDALIAKAARKAGAERILTFNVADFKRVWPEGAAHIAAP